VQDDEAVDEEVPALHHAQAVAPVEEEYVPAEQLEQAEAPAEEYVPAPQLPEQAEDVDVPDDAP